MVESTMSESFSSAVLSTIATLPLLGSTVGLHISVDRVCVFMEGAEVLLMCFAAMTRRPPHWNPRCLETISNYLSSVWINSSKRSYRRRF